MEHSGEFRSLSLRAFSLIGALAAVCACLLAFFADTGTYAASPPPNDNFASSEAIPGLPFRAEVGTDAATEEPGEPQGCGSIDHTVWYTYTPEADILVTAVAGDGIADFTEFFTSLAVYTGDSIEALSLVRCEQHNPGPTPPAFAAQAFADDLSVVLLLAAGVTYRFQAGGWDGRSGNLVFEVIPSSDISGTVFDDGDSDGMRDPGEPGLCCWQVELRQDGDVWGVVATGEDGSYEFPAALVGDYTVELHHVRTTYGFCVDSFGGLYPLRLDECLLMDVTWSATTPAIVDVFHAGETVIDFGLREPDAMPVMGSAILNDGYATGQVSAYIGDVECGTAAIGPPGTGYHMFEMLVLGAGERAGCARDGDEIEFRIAGVAGQETPLVFHAGTGQPTLHDVHAVPDHAWFWAEEVALSAGAAGSVVTAFVDGVECGQAKTIDGTRFGPVVGFSKLVVPSDAIAPNCGHDGAIVTFAVDGVMTGTAIPWRRSIQLADLNLPGAVGNGDADCSGDVDALDGMYFLRMAAGLLPLGDRICDYGVDCNGGADVIDALQVLRWVAALPVELPEGCDPIGRSGP